ncbi:MAG: glycosyltransferase [Bacteroidia bacterium]|nr:glycosyltransferase [Bacteroidia bacterium]
MKGSKHILFISSWYPNRNDPTHGIFNRHFAEAASLQHKVTVLHVTSDASLDKKFEIVEEDLAGIRTITVYYKKVKTGFPVFSQFIKRKRLITAFDKGYEILKHGSGTPDLIQLNVAMPAGLGVLHLTAKYNLPFVLNEGWTGYMSADGSYRGFFLKWFTRKIVSKAKVIMPVSETLEDAMKQQGLKGNYQIVPNVVNTNTFERVMEKRSDDVLRLIHISTLDQRQKNVLGIINAVQSVLETNIKIQLTLVGEGDDRTMLEEQVNQKGLQDKVTFKGVVLKDEIVKEIQRHDALVMFSNYESFCVVIAETMACGKPVISSRCGGLTSLITEDLGYTVEPGDESSLSTVILKLHSNYQNFDPMKIRKFVTDNFTQEIVSGKLNKIYSSVL